jgi:hypothetical protein
LNPRLNLELSRTTYHLAYTAGAGIHSAPKSGMVLYSNDPPRLNLLRTGLDMVLYHTSRPLFAAQQAWVSFQICVTSIVEPVKN